jgi:hypothetical protein
VNLPTCPNFRDRTCERSALRLVGENEYSYAFYCATCKLIWAVSKPRSKERGRYEAQLARIQQATAAEYADIHRRYSIRGVSPR